MFYLFTVDYINEVLHEVEVTENPKSGSSSAKDDWESGITFTAHPSGKL